MDTKEGIVLIASCEECWYESFLHGIEEESVPIYCISAENEEDIIEYDALAMATFASKYSAFEIGVGADNEKIVIRHRLQKESTPLLDIDKEDGEEIIRIQGSNAARIVKKLPLFLADERLWKPEV